MIVDKFQSLKCKICGSKDIKKIGSPDTTYINASYLRHNYKVVQCNSCSFYFVNPEIDFSSVEWEELYSNNYFPEMTVWHVKDRLNDLNNRLSKLEKACSHEVKNFLDIGSGEGRALLNAKSRGWKAFGFDIYDHRIKVAKSSDIDFRQGDFFEMGYPDNFFDVIYMDSVLEHVLTPLNYLKEINRILKKGGTVYIGVPNEDSLFNDVRGLLKTSSKKDTTVKLRPFQEPFHIIGFNEKSIKKIAEEAQFRIFELRNFAARFEFRKHKFGSRGFLVHFLTLPIDLIAILLKREVYFEAILIK